MKLVRLAALGSVLLLAGCASTGPQPTIQNVQVLNGGSEISRTKNYTTASGKSVRVGFAFSQNLDCSEVSGVTMRLGAPPSNGEATVERGSDFPNYARGNPRAHCNPKKAVGMVMTYHPQPDFVGTDHFGFDTFYPGGKAIHNDVNVTVE